MNMNLTQFVCADFELEFGQPLWFFSLFSDLIWLFRY